MLRQNKRWIAWLALGVLAGGLSCWVVTRQSKMNGSQFAGDRQLVLEQLYNQAQKREMQVDRRKTLGDDGRSYAYVPEDSIIERTGLSARRVDFLCSHLFELQQIAFSPWGDYITAEGAVYYENALRQQAESRREWWRMFIASFSGGFFGGLFVFIFGFLEKRISKRHKDQTTNA